MSFGQVNTDVIGTSVAGSNLGAGNASIMKNRIINGAMVVSQRNGTSSVTPASGDYILDRWRYSASQTSKVTAQQNAGSVTPPAGYINYLGITSSSAYSVAAGDYFGIQQRIEGLNITDLGWGTANAKTVTLSALVYSSLTGTFGGALQNYNSSRSYPFTYSIPTANTWTQISITIAGDTSGTWLTTNGIGILAQFALGVGSTYSGTAGAWAGTVYESATGATSVVGTNGATFYITGVQLEVGSSATGFEYVNYQTSLANCQRYYWKVSGSNASQYIFSGYWSSSSSVVIVAKTAVTMRTAPTVSASNVIAVNPTGADGLYSSISSQQATIEGSRLSLTVTGTSGVINGYPSALGFSTTSPNYMEFSAEL
jgi:hypothetical protein